jgi:flagellar basal body-associated protein FliL
MADHSKPSQYDSKSPGGLDARLIAIIGLISVVLFIVIVAATEAWFYNQQARQDQANARRGNPQLQAYVEAEDARLHSIQRIDGDDAHVTVPIDWAMARFAEQHRQK